MYADIDKERVRKLAREILEAIGEENEARVERIPIAEDDVVYTTVEVARLLGVSQAWVTAHVEEFPGAFRLSEGQRANYRFPKSAVDEFKKKQAI